MKIDQVSTHIIKLALVLDSKYPGFASEIWLDKELILKLKEELPKESKIQDYIEETKTLITRLEDKRRKKYLEDILHSLIFQLGSDFSKISYSQFSKNTFGFKIERVSASEIKEIELKIKKLEGKIGETRQEVYKKYSISKDDLIKIFKEKSKVVKELLPKYLTDYKSEFLYEVVSDKPWTAFNTHFGVGKSKLTLNKDISWTGLDFLRLACHEGFGGHHSELSLKDKLLEEERGEHGLVITFSPQTFVSEGIAESMYVLLDVRNKLGIEGELAWYYDRLTFALQNLATFLFFDDKKSKEEIDKELSQFSVSDKTREGILNFSTDPVFGRYAPVYYSAFNFIEGIYKDHQSKEKLAKELFTQPCTPRILS